MSERLLLRGAVIALAALAATAGSAAAEDSAPKAPAAVREPKAIEVPRRPEDQFFLANRYLRGSGLPADPARANELFRMAAEQGYDRAQLQLGLSYLKGRGIERNPVLGMQWIGKAAEQNNPRAQLELAVAYWNRADRVEAVKWLHLASWSGSLAAQGMVRSYVARLTPPERQEALERARRWRTDHGLPADVEPPHGTMHVRPS